MKTRRDQSVPCVVGQSAIDRALCTGLADTSPNDPESCEVIESMGKLMALGLSAEEIEDLDIGQPMLQAICEYARLDEPSGDPTSQAANPVGTTLELIDDQIHSLDMEIEMLGMRKQALERRTRVLQKLARSLDAPLM